MILATNVESIDCTTVLQTVRHDQITVYKDAIKLHLQKTNLHIIILQFEWHRCWQSHSWNKEFVWFETAFRHSRGSLSSYLLWFLCCGVQPQCGNFSRFKSWFCETIKIMTAQFVRGRTKRTFTKLRCGAVSNSLPLHMIRLRNKAMYPQ